MTGSSRSEQRAVTRNVRGTFGVWGPRIGMFVGAAGGLLALIGFLLPWAFGQSGMRVVTAMRGYSLSYSLVWLVPLVTLGMVGVAIVGLLASFWGKVARRTNIVGAVLIVVLVMLACCPFSLFLADHLFFMTTAASRGLANLGLGFWVTGLGLAICIAGGIIGIVSSVIRGKP